MANSFESVLLFLVTAVIAIVVIALVKHDLNDTRRARSVAPASKSPNSAE